MKYNRGMQYGKYVIVDVDHESKKKGGFWVKYWTENVENEAIESVRENGIYLSYQSGLVEVTSYQPPERLYLIGNLDRPIMKFGRTRRPLFERFHEIEKESQVRFGKKQNLTLFGWKDGNSHEETLMKKDLRRYTVKDAGDEWVSLNWFTMDYMVNKMNFNLANLLYVSEKFKTPETLKELAIDVTASESAMSWLSDVQYWAMNY